jgi:predicted amidophosphoribosyltransferase
MLKCGQKDNANYTFGVSEKQIKKANKDASKFCSACGSKIRANTDYCSKCGSPV